MGGLSIKHNVRGGSIKVYLVSEPDLLEPESGSETKVYQVLGDKIMQVQVVLPVH